MERTLISTSELWSLLHGDGLEAWIVGCRGSRRLGYRPVKRLRWKDITDATAQLAPKVQGGERAPLLGQVLVRRSRIEPTAIQSCFDRLVRQTQEELTLL